METGFWVAISCIGGAMVLLTMLMHQNLKMLKETKQERLEARRRERAARKARYKHLKPND